MSVVSTKREDIGCPEPDEHATIASLFSEGIERYRWKYLRNPWTDTPHVFVRRRGGEIDGAVGFVPLPLRTPWGDHVELLLGDVALPEGDCSALFAYARDELSADYRWAFAAGAPPERTPAAAAAWTRVESLRTYLRVERASAFLGAWSRPLDGCLDAATRAIGRLHRGIDDIERTLDPAPIDVVSDEGVPSERLVNEIPVGSSHGIHIAESPRVHRWRFADPTATHRTFIAYRHGTPTGAVVLERRQVDDITVGRLAGIRTDGERSTLGPLLRAVLADTRGLDLLLAPGTLNPGRMERYGFLASDRFPGTTLVDTHALHVLPLTDASRRLPVRNPDVWELSLTERGIP